MSSEILYSFPGNLWRNESEMSAVRAFFTDMHSHGEVYAAEQWNNLMEGLLDFGDATQGEM
jgi:hypothetical protein